MKIFRACSVLFVAAGLCAPLFLNQPANAQPKQAKKKRVLFIGQTKGFQHDSVSYAAGTLWQLGKDTGLWETYIKTDCQLITKKKLGGNAKNLDFFDAVAFYTTGELDMDDEQKASLISFVKEDGKGFIGLHSAPDTFYKWPAYGELVGGYFDGHPWNTFDSPNVVEDAANPMMAKFSKTFTAHDEIYQARNFSRGDVRVLARLDESKLDLTKKGIKRQDKDWATVWIKKYGKGRVFYTTYGHTNEMYDRPDIQHLLTEATKWCLGLTEVDATPRPRP